MAIDVTQQDSLKECPRQMAKLLETDYGARFGIILHTDFKVEDPNLTKMLDELDILGCEMESFFVLKTIQKWNGKFNRHIWCRKERPGICC